jgi:hypothetical protein
MGHVGAVAVGAGLNEAGSGVVRHPRRKRPQDRRFFPRSLGRHFRRTFCNLELIQKIQPDRCCRTAAHYGRKTMAAVGLLATIPLKEGQSP